MSEPVTPEAVTARAAALYGRRSRAWAVGDVDSAVLELPLHPPTERAVLTDVDAAVAWIDAWRAAEAAWPIDIAWGSRRWASVGTQSVPERVRLEGAQEIAAVAGKAAEYAALEARCGGVIEALAPLTEDVDAVRAAVRRHAGALAALSERDFATLTQVVAWLAAHPVSGKRVRELPIRGIDTKWLEKRMSMVQDLVGVVTGREDLGLRTGAGLVRVRVLDPDAGIGGLWDVAAPVEQLAGTAPEFSTVLITENLETLLALPEREGVLAIHGAGYAVDRLADLSWLRERRVLYWGDLDSHGFAILHRARSAGIAVESVLMDEDTLLAFEDLWVEEPQPFRGTLSTLTPGERVAFEALAAHGFPRLEQERVPWDYALEALESAWR